MIFLFSIFIINLSIKCSSLDCYSSSDDCKSITISEKNSECCKVTMNTFSSCTIFTKHKMTQFEINSTEITFKDYYSFSIYNLGSVSLVTYIAEYDCTSQSVSFNYSPDFSVTEEQREFFGKDNYCLRLYYEGLFGMNLYPERFEIEGYEKKLIQKSDCDNAIVASSSEEYETCAYASYKFKLKNGTNKTLNTCLLLSKTAFIIKSIVLDQALMMDFLLYSKVDGEFFENFEIEIIDKDNNKLLYDHLKKNFKEVDNDDNINKNEDNFSDNNDDKEDKNTNTETDFSKSLFTQVTKIIMIIILLYLF